MAKIEFHHDKPDYLFPLNSQKAAIAQLDCSAIRKKLPDL